MTESDTIRAPGEVIPPGESPSTVTAEPGQAHAMRTALVVAVVADVMQILLFPLFAQGVLSPLNDALDVVVAITLIRLLGWHWAFLPSLLSELLPIADELPCWTFAVLYVKSRRASLDPNSTTQSG